MEYQKIVNSIDDYASNQPSKFKTRNWVEINEEHIMLIVKLSLKLQC